ncbi:MAG: antibiotic biosynthesis monooxygenase [Pseudomonadota bacterium]
MSESDTPVCLVSQWKLKSGLDEKLLAVLQNLAGKVEAAEPDTLMYRVHLPTAFPLEEHGQPSNPPAIPLADQKAVIFVEVYRNAAAFATHTQGDVFKNFLSSTLHYFEPDPDRPGWPVTETPFMELVSGFVRCSIESA